MIVMTAPARAAAREAAKEAAREAEKEVPPRVTVAAVVKAARAARAGVNEHLRRSFCETDQIGHSLVLVVKYSICVQYMCSSCFKSVTWFLCVA